MRSCGAPGEEAAALAMLEITVSIFSAKGRAASAADCARRSFEAATICIALVIFCVALVEAMRTRMSFSDAILRLAHSTSVALFPGLGRSRGEGLSRSIISPHPTGLAGRPPPRAREVKK